MPRAPVMFYDASCGPCTLWARAFEWLGRGSLQIDPLASREADRELRGMPEQVRYSAFHLLRDGEVRTGTDALGPLLGVTLGPSAECLITRVSPGRWAARAVYQALWEGRRRYGCGRTTPEA
jgi:predicted DCC family thiol-disulfide oxidoreductase YuxK